MQGYMMGHSAGLPTYVTMKYGGSNMADKWQKQCFFWILTMSYGLLVEVAKILQLQQEIAYAGLQGGP